jgi:hypothetical protein
MRGQSGGLFFTPELPEDARPRLFVKLSVRAIRWTPDVDAQAIINANYGLPLARVVGVGDAIF